MARGAQTADRIELAAVSGRSGRSFRLDSGRVGAWLTRGRSRLYAVPCYAPAGVNVLLTLALLCLHALACHGWGRGLSRLLRLEVDNPAVHVALGLAVVLALGGLSNLGGLAVAGTLWSIVGAGVLLCLRPPQRTAAVPAGLLFAVLGVCVLACSLAVSTLVPPWAFNYHDDYQKYFAHPARMLQTGSLRVPNGSALGFETLGGQAFLHGFVLAWGRFDLLNAVDLGFGWPLCIALAGLGPCRDGRQLALRLVALLCVLVLNPQIVNVSATFTACALCLAWLELGRSQKLQTRADLLAYGCASGVLFGGLCALKTTFVALAGVLAVLCACALWMCCGLARARSWTVAMLAALLITLLPWLGVHASLYLSGGARAQLLDTLAVPYQVDPLSLEPVLYGGDSFGMYSFGVGVSALCAAYGWQRSRAWAAQLGVVAAGALLLVYLLLLYVVAPRSQGAVTIMRLFAPIFIALVAGGVSLCAQHASARSGIVPLLFALAICLTFARGVGTRLTQALAYGSILAFPDLAEDENYLRYNHDVLYGSFARSSAAAQAAVPRGAPLVAYINTPFWLDFARNPIADLDPAGLATPWADIPPARYVLWELDGFATIQLRGYEKERDRPGLLQARIGDAGLRLTRVLIALARSSQVIYSDGRALVMKLPTETTLGDAYRATRPTRR